jgi:2-oxopent-4-enoate/cis-2-oxohex-4-enoate hydratase
MPIVVADAVQRLVKNRSVREAAPPLSENAPDMTLEQGYHIQRSLERALCEGGDRVVGWKAGFTNATLQESYGVHEPVLGFLLGSGAFSSGDAVPLSRFVSLGLEVEMGFVMSSDLSGPGVTSSSALLAVAGAIPCFELIDFRVSGKPRGTDIVADGVYANAMVLGGPVTSVQGLDLSLEGVVYEENGQRVATATAAEVMGNPLNSLTWLANALGRLGGKLRAGDVVLTGSISKVFRPKTGDSVRAAFTRIGSVSCRFV